jgi:hypothetical protein
MSRTPVRFWRQVLAPAVLGPVLGCSAGALFGGLCAVLYWLLSGGANAFPLGVARCAVAGVVAGGLVGLLRAWDRFHEAPDLLSEDLWERNAAGPAAPAAGANGDVPAVGVRGPFRVSRGDLSAERAGGVGGPRRVGGRFPADGLRG